MPSHAARRAIGHGCSPPYALARAAQILGYNECFEPYTSNLYMRRVKAGEFIVINPHLVHDLMAAGLWDDELRARLIEESGSVQAS